MILHIIALISVFLFGGADRINTYLQIHDVPTTLKGTSYSSRFYYYCNFYVFETDSTGYSQDGQTARSMAVDTVALGISSDEILYDDARDFTYKVVNDVLVITYKHLSNPENQDHTREFAFLHEHSDWISLHEYAYGHEVLSVGNKIQRFIDSN